MGIWEQKLTQRKNTFRSGEKPSDCSVSIHEASHAVVASVYGYIVTEVTEEHTERGYPPGSERHDERWAWRDLVVGLAGFCGVAKVHGSYEKLLYDFECFYNDLADAVHVLEEKGDDRANRGALLGQAIRESFKAVDDNWDKIERVADALSSSGDPWFLSGKEFSKLLGPSAK